jgi:ActR/RegA family two-component response regulator
MQKKSCLVVDDKHHRAKEHRRLLENSGFRVDIAPTVERAQTLLRSTRQYEWALI